MIKTGRKYKTYYATQSGANSLSFSKFGMFNVWFTYSGAYDHTHYVCSDYYNYYVHNVITKFNGRNFNWNYIASSYTPPRTK